MKGVGIWPNRDPFGEWGGINLYQFCYNAPLGYADIDGLAPGDPYPSADAAGIQSLKDINPTSQKQGTEYAGWIYQNPDGTYSYTKPNKGTKHSSDNGTCPAGKKPAGDYHTHPKYPGYDYNHFSQTDKNTNDKNKVPGYLGTLGGDVKKYTPGPGGGTVTTIATGVK